MDMDYVKELKQEIVMILITYREGILACMLAMYYPSYVTEMTPLTSS